MAAAARSSMLSAAAGGSAKFQTFLGSGQWAAATSDDAVTALTTEQAQSLFATAANALQTIVEREFMENENAAAPGKDDTSVMELLARATSLMVSFSDDKERPLPAAFMHAAGVLHDAMLYLPETKDGMAVRTGICRLCEKLWVQERRERTRVIVLTLPLLLVTALEPGATDADVKRLWAMRDAVDQFDLLDPASETLKDMLLRCFAAPLFLRNADNRRFLAHVLASTPALVGDMHAALLGHIPGTARVLDGLGEVYFKAWSATLGDSDADTTARAALEEACIQDLMTRAMHAALPDTFKAVRRVLQAFTDAKMKRGRGKGVDAMLLKCYRPILFRGVAATNAAVRKNAITLMLDAFPLRDEALPAEDNTALLQQQFDALSTLLTDDVPAVREACVRAIASILNAFWEIIPTAASSALLGRIAGDAAHDARAPTVRVAAVEAMAFMLSQVLCHPVLATQLPSMGCLLHDRSEKVRSAMAALLGEISDLRSINVFTIASEQDMLARLALDASTGKIAEPLVKVLQPSLCPVGAEHTSSTALLQRIVDSLSRHEAATLVFFAHVHRVLDILTLAKVAALLNRGVAMCVRTRNKRVLEAGGADAEEQEDGDDATFQRSRKGKAAAVKRDRSGASRAPSSAAVTGMDADNLPLMVAMVRAMSALWAHVAPAAWPSGGAPSDEAAQARAILLKDFGGDAVARLLRDLTGSTTLREAEVTSDNGSATSAITTALLSIASHMPRDAVSDLPAVLWTHLCEMTATDAQGAAGNDAVAKIVDCLCSWGRAGEMLSAASAAVNARVATANSAKVSKATAAASGMHVNIALAVIQHVCRMHFQRGDVNSALETAIDAALKALAAGVRATSAFLETASPRITAEHVTGAVALADACVRTWCHVIVSRATAVASARGGAEADAVVNADVTGMTCWITEHAIRAAMTHMDAAELAAAHTDDAAAAAAEARAAMLQPAADAVLRIITSVTNACGDLAGVGLALLPTLQLYKSLSSGHALAVGDAAGSERYTSCTPVEWLASGNARAFFSAHRMGLQLGAVACGTVFALSSSPSVELVTLEPASRREVMLAIARMMAHIPQVHARLHVSTAVDGMEADEEGADDGDSTGPSTARIMAYDDACDSMHAALTACVKTVSTENSRLYASELVGATLPEVEVTMTTSSRAFAKLMSGAASSMDDLSDTPAMHAVVVSCARIGGVAVSVLAQELASRMRILAGAYAHVAEPHALPTIAMACALLRAGGSLKLPRAARAEAAATLKAGLAGAAFAPHAALNALDSCISRATEGPSAARASGVDGTDAATQPEAGAQQTAMEMVTA